MCEGYWDARLHRWVSLEELEERELETPSNEGVAIPTIPSVDLRRKPVAVLR